MKKYVMALMCQLIMASLMPIGYAHATATAIAGREFRDTDSIRINGVIKGSNPSAVGMILVVYDQDPRLLRSDAVGISLALPPQQGTFAVSFPSRTGIRRLESLGIMLQTGSLQYRNFVTEPGDDVQATILLEGNSVSLSFEGKGAAKYQCRVALEEKAMTLGADISAKIRLRGPFENWVAEDLDALFKAVETTEHEMNEVLEKYRPSISEDVYQAMKADLVYDIMSMRLKKANLYAALMESTGEKDRIARLYKSQSNAYGGIPEAIACASPGYIDYLGKKIALDRFMETGEPTMVTDTYQGVLARYTGELKDRILLNMVNNSSGKADLWGESVMPNTSTDPESSQEFVAKVLDVVQAPVIVTKVRSIANKYRMGVPVFDFSLPDTAGRLIGPDDLKGNVYVLDFWFTGCLPCVKQAERLKTVIKPALNAYPDFQVVTVNLDPQRKSWLTSVASEKYSEKTDLNLFTDGQAFNHPLVKYYDIKGAPFMFLVDRKRNLVDIIHYLDSEEMIEKIKATLAEQG